MWKEIFEYFMQFFKELGEEKKETKVVATTLKKELLKYGSKNAELVKYAKKRLLAHGFGGLTLSNGNFLETMELTVKKFQKAKGLTADGVIGPKTWQALEEDVSNYVPPKTNIAQELILMAKSQVGVRENGFNKGKMVEEFQKVVDGKAQSEAWCMAFMQWVIKKVCDQHGIKNPMYQSEHCYTVWNGTPEKYRLSKPKAGSIMIQVTKTKGKTNGHTGIVTGGISGDNFSTVEGNTNGAGSSEGDGVYNKTRSIHGSSSMNVKGFIDIEQMILDKLGK